MATKIPISEFDAGDRVPLDVVQRQAGMLQRALSPSTLLHSLINEVAIVNNRRQIVVASENFRRLIPEGFENVPVGLRPGEVLDCVHARETVRGCGTAEACLTCGMFQAITGALGGEATERECRITRFIGCRTEALDLLILATPLVSEEETFSLVAIQDISHQKRRQVYEEGVLSELISGTNAVAGLAAIAREEASADLRPSLDRLQNGLQELLENLHGQQDLAAAERGELQPRPALLNSLSVLAQVAAMYARQDVANGRRLVISPESASVDVVCDRALLKRVLGSLIRNALEASDSGDTVTVGCSTVDGRIRWWVRNRVFIPKPVQHQVFSRSFTTKGMGHGLGTYSAKLLTEQYMGGTCAFTSSEGEGTVFTIELPVTPPNSMPPPHSGFSHLPAWH